MDDMFFTFATYPENMHDKVGLKRALLRAVVIFCEALRFGPVFIIVLERFLADPEKSTALPALFWDWIGCWGNLSEFALKTGKHNGVLNMHEFAEYCLANGIPTFGDLIGRDDSVLMFLMRKEDVLLPNGKIPRGLQGRTHPGVDVREPRTFDADDSLVGV